jgi:uncharacterized RDD family membrane protein YckC
MSNPYAPPQAAVRDIVDPSLQAVPAERGTRLGAAILDSFVFMLMVYTPLFIGGVFAGVTSTIPAAGVEDAAAAADGANLAIGIAGIFTFIGLIVWLVITIVLMRRNGQSIGKKATGIKVVRSDGSPVSLARLIWMRNVLNWVISIIPLYGLIDALFIFGESRQCLHDKLADTIVVKA